MGVSVHEIRQIEMNIKARKAFRLSKESGGWPEALRECIQAGVFVFYGPLAARRDPTWQEQNECD
jgi:hypothetical protein